MSSLPPSAAAPGLPLTRPSDSTSSDWALDGSSSAIAQREGARAEAIMREHSRLAQRNLREAMRAPHLDHMPGVRLIRQRP